MDELHRIIEKGEKILWQGKPKFWPFVLQSILVPFIAGLIFFAVWILPLLTMTNGHKDGGEVLAKLIFFNPVAWIIILFVLFQPIYTILSYRVTEYAITNKRVLLQSGVIGRDYKIADFDKITNADVNVGVIDKLLGQNTGRIDIMTAGTFVNTKNGRAASPYALASIESPYEVFKLFKNVSHDVKTDIEFPNKYRPSENPGYRTDYKAK